MGCNNSPLIHGSIYIEAETNSGYFPDVIFTWIFLIENVWIWIEFTLKFIHNGLINNILALVKIMAWRGIGDKPLSEPMMDQVSDAYMRHSASMS